MKGLRQVSCPYAVSIDAKSPMHSSNSTSRPRVANVMSVCDSMSELSLNVLALGDDPNVCTQHMRRGRAVSLGSRWLGAALLRRRKRFTALVRPQPALFKLLC